MVHNERRENSRSRGERNMKLIKKILIGLLIIIGMVLMSIAPSEPEGEVSPYMQDVVYIPSKVYARGKPKKIKKKTMRYEYEYIGKFKLTAYCSCTKCCGRFASGKTASGVKATSNHTIAVDPKVIPLGTQVKIGKTIYTAEDTGGGIKGHKIDIFFDSHSEALDFGVQRDVKVYKVNPPKVVAKLKSLKKGVMAFASSARSKRNT